MKKAGFLLSVTASALLAEPFDLGTINVKGDYEVVNTIEQSVDADVIAQQNDETVAEALDNMSGISMGLTGARNESTISIRGFDAKRIGVFIDGVPVYVPYDGNFDYGRFLTADVAQIDVSKSYSSVVYGANTMGGVINIVSRKPTKALEGNVNGMLVLDSAGSTSRYETALNVGTRQDHYYVQLGGVYADQDHYRLSSEYGGSASQPQGDRLRSEANDYKISVKAGYIADDNSEIAVGYAAQRGEKQQPPSTDPTYAKIRYWDWPMWDKDTVYVTGQKNFESSYLKASVYYDTYTNELFSYDDANYTTMNKGSSFKSRYEDYSYGARLEYGIDTGSHMITAAANYKKDVHNGYDLDKVTEAKTKTENFEDHTISLGLEDTYTISKNWRLLAGIGYDYQKADKIYDTTTAYQEMLTKESRSAFSPEAALIYTLPNGDSIRASIARKTYMPSMKDRYSRKFNSYVPNAELDNEVATHYDLGYFAVGETLSYSVDAFYSVVDDAIQSVVYDANTSLKQNQNVGTFEHVGGEFNLKYRTEAFEAGGNYTFTEVKNVDSPEVKRTDVPRHQLFAYTQVPVGGGLSFYGDVKWREGAYSEITDGSYVKVPTFVTFDVKASYRPVAALTAEVGIKNLTDRLVVYNLGYPEAGREYFAVLNYTF